MAPLLVLGAKMGFFSNVLAPLWCNLERGQARFRHLTGSQGGSFSLSFLVLFAVGAAWGTFGVIFVPALSLRLIETMPHVELSILDSYHHGFCKTLGLLCVA